MPKATNYFAQFPQTTVDSYSVTNLLSRAKIKDAIDLTQSKIFIPYVVSEGERPETVAENYYGSTMYFWIVLYMNNIKNVYEDWPKTVDVLNEYISSKYPSMEYAQTTVHHFEDEDGDYIPESEWDGTESRRVTIFEWEVQRNDSKREIYLVRSEYRDRITREFREIFRKKI